jgi:hypothetical protein
MTTREALADIVYEFGARRGDLSEQYARDQMVARLLVEVRAAQAAAWDAAKAPGAWNRENPYLHDG